MDGCGPDAADAKGDRPLEVLTTRRALPDEQLAAGMMTA
jgi:hypothetical protein